MFKIIAAALAMSLLSVGPGYSKPITPVTKVTQYKDVEGTWALVRSDGGVNEDKQLSLQYWRHRYILEYGNIECSDIGVKFTQVQKNLVCDLNANATGQRQFQSDLFLTIKYLDKNEIYIKLQYGTNDDEDSNTFLEGVFAKVGN